MRKIKSGYPEDLKYVGGKDADLNLNLFLKIFSST